MGTHPIFESDFDCLTDRMSDDSLSDVGKEYILGVVEGFYGNPWTKDERFNLLKRMKEQNMNAYIYAPKDDEKHRNRWRIEYDQIELNDLKELIENCNTFGIEFVFSVSPGLDLVFHSQQDYDQLLKKFQQLKDLGCRSFAVLWDDINAELQGVDAKVFESPGVAQCYISNSLFEALSPCKYFMMCPTEYCGAFAQPNVQDSKYLKDLGEKLHQEIEIMWTGPRVVSPTISFKSIQQITNILKRKPLIWDNIHANDYDRRRVFLGPYSGRNSNLVGFTAGVLTNPNCEYDANYVAIHTLGSWKKSYKGVKDTKIIEDVFPTKKPLDEQIAENMNSDDDHEEEHIGHGEYCPRRSLEIALSDWLPVFLNSNVPTDSQLNLEDLKLLSDLYYLPYEYGTDAIKMFSQINYCLKNYRDCSLEDSEDSKLRNWISKLNELIGLSKRIDQLADRLSLLNYPPANVVSPLVADVSNIYNVLLAFLIFIQKFSSSIKEMAINTDLSTESLDTEQKEILDQESQLQILYSITSRLLVTLPRKIMNGFYFGEVRTPYFPGFKFDFLNPGSTRHGIFDEVSEMEFDDMDTWPVSELIRLDNVNVCDVNIMFCVNATIHPLEHASVLFVKDPHYDDTVNLHFAVRQINSMASLHSASMILILFCFQIYFIWEDIGFIHKSALTLPSNSK